jgi:hypothetical protein
MHMTMTAIDPPGAADRRWQCPDCGLVGTFDDVASTPCTAAKVGTITPEQQLEAWASGDSVCPSTKGECCPDFSCCQPKLAWAPERRASFVAADQGMREKMLMGSLGSAISLALDGKSKKVYVTRGEPKDRE